MSRYRAGQWTAAFVLILAGVLLLIDEWFGPAQTWGNGLWRFWPLALVLFGLEVIVAGRRMQQVKVSLGGAFVMVFLLIAMELYSLIEG